MKRQNINLLKIVKKKKIIFYIHIFFYSINPQSVLSDIVDFHVFNVLKNIFHFLKKEIFHLLFFQTQLSW